ncbi:MAG: hypothetical protein ACRDQI_09435 [Pseudonocardiaceae bacterium]
MTAGSPAFANTGIQQRIADLGAVTPDVLGAHHRAVKLDGEPSTPATTCSFTAVSLVATLPCIAMVR